MVRTSVRCQPVTAAVTAWLPWGSHMRGRQALFPSSTVTWTAHLPEHSMGRFSYAGLLSAQSISFDSWGESF